MIKALTNPIDKAILIYFRFMAGILMSQELINGLIIGKFKEYTEPKFHFSYYLLDWIKPWGTTGMALHYLITILAGFAVAVGFHYRLSVIILFLGHLLLFLMEMSEYINHSYLYCLISFCMIWLPLENNKKSTAPAWILYLILFHMSLAYFFGGIAKLNADWLSGTPMDLFLKSRVNYPLGFIYKQSWAPMIFSYGGLLFDLLIVPLMLIPLTRKFGLIASILFHISNVMMFGLATFPWFSMVLTTMFFDPSWPRKIPGIERFLPAKSKGKREYVSPLVISAVALYAIVHVTLPFRHWIYPGNTSWTEQGHMFAWRMMLRDKHGSVNFIVRSKESNQFHHIKLKDYLTERQIKDMTGKPDMILQFAHYLRDEYQKKFNSPVAVYASTLVAFNGRPKKEMIKPGTDLALEERKLGAYNWIVPLEENSELITEALIK